MHAHLLICFSISLYAYKNIIWHVAIAGLESSLCIGKNFGKNV